MMTKDLTPISILTGSLETLSFSSSRGLTGGEWDIGLQFKFGSLDSLCQCYLNEPLTPLAHATPAPTGKTNGVSSPLLISGQKIRAR